MTVRGSLRNKDAGFFSSADSPATTPLFRFLSPRAPDAPGDRPGHALDVIAILALQHALLVDLL